MSWCLNCGARYGADPRHDYGYCSDRCELEDWDGEEAGLTSVDR